MKTESLISNVSDTSFWVAYYRALESERKDALFHDPLAQKLVGERGRKISESMSAISRYTQWSVVSRTVMIDRFIEKLIREGVDTVINLGAGLDTRPYRMNIPEKLSWIEADYPHIIDHKNKVLQDEKPKCKLTRFAIDLADGEKRKIFFKHVASDSKKVLILTEGVLPYLTAAQVADLSADLLAQDRFVFWIAEYFDKRVYRYLQRTVRTLKMKNAPFQFYPEDWFHFFNQLGWIEKETMYSGEIALELKRRPPMPLWARFIMPFISQKRKQQSRRMAGYVIFKRKN